MNERIYKNADGKDFLVLIDGLPMSIHIKAGDPNPTIKLWMPGSPDPKAFYSGISQPITMLDLPVPERQLLQTAAQWVVTTLIKEES